MESAVCFLHSISTSLSVKPKYSSKKGSLSMVYSLNIFNADPVLYFLIGSTPVIYVNAT